MLIDCFHCLLNCVLLMLKGTQGHHEVMKSKNSDGKRPYVEGDYNMGEVFLGDVASM